MNVLFISSEAWPLVKTGGLGDIAHSLPHALTKIGVDVRVVLPAYRTLLRQVSEFHIAGWFDIHLANKSYVARILECEHEAFDKPLWLIDIQGLFDREGNPYGDADGYDWADNAERFTLFSKAAALLSMGYLHNGWNADVVHCNDWQTGLVPAFLEEEANCPRRIFTIHNMAYGGIFPQETFNQLHLPAPWWSSDGVEFYGNLSMLKAGLVYSNMITTVSPTYAEEICTPSFAYGMEGILSSRQYKLKGILNGIDNDVWNPEDDSFIPHHYSASKIGPGKKKNKEALLESMGLEVNKETLQAPLFGMVSRLVEQKGVDMVIDVIPQLIEESKAIFVIIGQGSAHYENVLQGLAEQYPGRVLVSISYSEQLAHQIEAACDFFMMPSRFEPCGLNQIYSLRYGTLPIVHKTGGLADTVIDAQLVDDKLNDDATGFVFDTPNSQTFLHTIRRALNIYKQKPHWKALQRNAMAQDFGWEKSAKAYLDLYQSR